MAPTSPATVSALSYAHIPATYSSFHSAFSNDPVQQYLFADLQLSAPWQTYIRESVRWVDFALRHSRSMRANMAFQIEQGTCFVTAQPAKEAAPPSAAMSLFSWVYQRVLRPPAAALWRTCLGLIRTPQQGRRFQEAMTKLEATVADTLGTDVDKYIYLDVLCCHAEKQGQGYGSALVRAITQIADVQQRKIWLVSSNLSNNKFYRRQGFEVVAECTLGESDANYTGPPIVVQMMVYDYASRK